MVASIEGRDDFMAMCGLTAVRGGRAGCSDDRQLGQGTGRRRPVRRLCLAGGGTDLDSGSRV